MTTQEQTDQATTAPIEPPEDAAPPIDPEAIHAEVNAEDIGDTAALSEDVITLDRFLRRRNRLAEERERIATQAKAALGRLDSQLKGLELVYAPLIEDITRRQLEAANRGKKKPIKSIRRIFGMVGFRTIASNIIVVDEAKAIDYLDKNAATCVVRTPRIAMAALKTLIEEGGGELPPGVDIKAAEEKFYVK